VGTHTSILKAKLWGGMMNVVAGLLLQLLLLHLHLASAGEKKNRGRLRNVGVIEGVSRTVFGFIFGNNCEDGSSHDVPFSLAVWQREREAILLVA